MQAESDNWVKLRLPRSLSARSRSGRDVNDVGVMMSLRVVPRKPNAESSHASKRTNDRAAINVVCIWPVCPGRGDPRLTNHCQSANR